VATYFSTPLSRAGRKVSSLPFRSSECLQRFLPADRGFACDNGGSVKKARTAKANPCWPPSMIFRSDCSYNDSNKQQNPAPNRQEIASIPMSQSSTIADVSCNRPARQIGFYAVITACVASLRGTQNRRSLVVNDSRRTCTRKIVRSLSILNDPSGRLIEATELPPGWWGKEKKQRGRGGSAARESSMEWLLFNEPDAVSRAHSAGQKLAIARENGAGAGSFSAEQVMENLVRKALTDVYTELSRPISFAERK